jgi:Pilus formation protein N terminal region
MSTGSMTHFMQGNDGGPPLNLRQRHSRTLIAMLLLSGLVLMPFAAFAQARTTGAIETVDVVVDHAKVVRLPEKVQTVIVGNPAIADVTVQKNGILVVTGKSYGVTNLIALDSTGTMLAESHIRVQAKTESVLTVHRGADRETYSCSPKCQPSMQMGDSAKHFDGIGGQVARRNQMATEQPK